MYIEIPILNISKKKIKIQTNYAESQNKKLCEYSLYRCCT